MARYKGRLRTALTSLDDGSKELSQADVVFVAPDHYGFSVEGRPYSPFVEPIRSELEELGLRTVVLARFPAELTGSKAHGNPISLNRSMMQYRVAQQFVGSQRAASLNPYRLALARTSPSLVLSIGSPIDLYAATRDLGICHFEIMHSMGLPDPPFGWEDRRPEELPDGVICFDKVCENSLARVAAIADSVVRIPHPFLRRYISNAACERSAEDLPARPGVDCKFPRKVLYTSQWGYAGDSQGPALLKENGVFPSQIEEAIGLTRDDAYWMIRLHPVQMERRYRKLHYFLEEFALRHENVEWRETSWTPLPELAQLADSHITMSSLSAYEVAAFGLRTLTLCPTLHPGGSNSHYFEDLEAEGYLVKGALDVASIRSWVAKQDRVDPRDYGLSDDSLWRRGVAEILERANIRLG